MRTAFGTVLVWIIVCALLASCSLSRSSAAPDSVNEKAEQSEAPIKILFGSAELGSEALVASVNRYEQLTGKQVEVHTFSHDNIQAKVYNELIQQSNTFDLILMNAAWVPIMISHLEPLSGYLTDEAYGDAQLEDYVAKILADGSLFNPRQLSSIMPPEEIGSVENITARGFDFYTLPIASNVLMGTYREDVFKDRLVKQAFEQRYDKEIALPATLAEYETLNRFFTSELDASLNKGISYGSTFMAGDAEASFIEYTAILNALGGSLYSDKQQPNLMTNEALKALELYGKWLNDRSISSPEVLDFGWEEAAIAFNSGQAAMGMNVFKMELSPAIRTGRLDYFTFPSMDEQGKGPYLITWGLAINKYSSQKDAAYELLNYLTSSEQQISALKYKNQITRISAFAASDELIIEQNRNYYDVLLTSIEHAALRPRMINYSQMVDIVSTAIQAYISGNASAEQALSQAQTELLELGSS